MKKISFGIVGGGWRAQFFLRVAREISDLFEIKVVVEPNEAAAEKLKNEWKVEVVRNTDALERFRENIEFLVLCLRPEVLPDVVKELTGKEYYILTETFSMETVEELQRYYQSIHKPKLIQIAEQYWLRPTHQARLKKISDGLIGTVTQAQISIGHGYHGISLLRKYLDVMFEPCRINAWCFRNHIVKGPGRFGYPLKEDIITDQQSVGIFEFQNKWGLFDFTEEQYFSEIRGYRILARGEKGEVDDYVIRYLKDFKTPVILPMVRLDSGLDGSMGVPGNEAIIFGEEWAYQSPFGVRRLSDDEIAIATMLQNMGKYVASGKSFYSFSEGCQDQYLDILMKKSIETGQVVETEPQAWQE